MTMQHYWGKYRAFVADNQDPEQRARLKLQIPAVLGDADSDWALPCLPFGGSVGHGWYAVPEVGAQLWAEFEGGDLHRPIWVGTFWQQQGDAPTGEGQSHPEAAVRLLQTPSGHVLQFDDQQGAEKIRLHHCGGAELLIDEAGSVALTDGGGARVTLDAQSGKLVVEDANGNSLTLDSSGIRADDTNGNHIQMSSSGVTVKGAQVVIDGSFVSLGGAGGEPLIKGTSLLTMFNTHMHSTSLGPSGPPLVPLTPSVLSTKITTS